MKNYSSERCISCKGQLIGNQEFKYCTCDDYSVNLKDNNTITHVQIEFYYKEIKYSVQVNCKKNFSVIDSQDKYGDWGVVYFVKEILDLSIPEWQHLINRVKKLKEFK